MELNLCWWNMGLSPPIRSNKKINIEDIGLAKQYLGKMIKKRALDIVALCEISKKENLDFKQLACELNMEYIDLSGRIGRIFIDISLMYKMSKLEFISSKFLTKLQPDNRTIRVGVSVVFKEIENQKIITLFLSHWPSVLSADDKIRRIAAQELRNSIDKLFENQGKDAQIICMGDYNTEPYSDSMINTLYATRDYHIIKKKR
ncbi:endonuclease/exonuclease/phosphatase family protein, partial [Proteus faecis]